MHAPLVRQCRSTLGSQSDIHEKAACSLSSMIGHLIRLLLNGFGAVIMSALADSFRLPRAMGRWS